MFQRYIDDIIYITKEENSKSMNSLLTDKFNLYNLDLTFREINTKDHNAELEFLDVLHVTDPNAMGGFYTKDFIKPTAVGQTFLNGKSHHPRQVFKGIMVGEYTRMKRLNETKKGLIESINKLENKCIKSSFEDKLVRETIQEIKTKIDEDVNNVRDKKNKNNMITWTTQFKNIIKLNKNERELAPNSLITFCKPQTLANHLLNYKEVCQGDRPAKKTGSSRKCNHCGLCGNWGKLNNMVLETEYITLKDGKKYQLKKDLTCKNYGIYAAKCKICNEYYVGQTKTPFSERWNHHRYIWKKMVNTDTMNKDNMEQKEKTNKTFELKDEQALFTHYVKNHSDETKKNLKLSDAYEIIFIEEPQYKNLDITENYWIGKLRSKINIARTYLPKYK